MKNLLRIIIGLPLLAAGRASAQEPPPVPCGNLPGCASATDLSVNPISDILLPTGIEFMLRVTAGLSILFIILAGYNMVLSRGDEAKISKAKWAILYTLGGLGLAILSQLILSSVVTESSVLGITDEVSLLSTIRELALMFMNVSLLIVIALASIRMVMAQGKPDEFKKASTWLTWAVLGAAVINLANAFVQIVASFFGV